MANKQMDLSTIPSEVNKIPWRRVDYRFESLSLIIDGLSKAITSCKERMELGGWYDAIWLREDTEPIFGLAFIACQNYIYGSIKDASVILGLSNYKSVISNTSPRIKPYNRTKIELIIALANYSKHLDDNLTTGTINMLKAFKLNYGDIDVTESPIFEGLSLLNNEWDLQDILSMVKEWRESLWSDKGYPRDSNVQL
ncbi:MAG: hypothetical protein EOO43_00715 [Flavobacterium sp.]|nr:MAG: hypothetical protein EOO43_00715 [Flavobacterium sp.]